MSSTLTIQALTAENFAPYGEVIEANPEKIRMINGGTTERHHGLGHAMALGEGGAVILNIFRGQPRQLPYKVDMMERHPLGSQSFQPLSGRPWLVVVARDDNGRPGEPAVFLARGDQGVNYPANVWHHPLMALDAVCDFLVVDRQGPGVNLQEYFYESAFLIPEMT
jgi:ureidoglycolate lyase